MRLRLSPNNCIAPSFMDTPLMRRGVRYERCAGPHAARPHRHAGRRRFGSPDVAVGRVVLCVRRVLPVDGGLTAG
jgi:NAD(P)-dependent dehydrogenase (short-subunit alcohol dehydrogenase family)